MRRTLSTQRPVLEILERPEGGPGGTGPTVVPPGAPTQHDVVVRLHQLVDALHEFSKVGAPAPSQHIDVPLLLDATEAGKLLSISRSKVLEMASQGDIPSLRLGGSVRIPRDRLVNWIEERTKEPDWLKDRRSPAWAQVDRGLER